MMIFFSLKNYKEIFMIHANSTYKLKSSTCIYSLSCYESSFGRGGASAPGSGR